MAIKKIKDNYSKKPSEIKEVLKQSGLEVNDTKTIYNAKQKTKNLFEPNDSQSLVNEIQLPMLHLSLNYPGKIPGLVLLKDWQINDMIYHIKNSNVILSYLGFKFIF